MSPTDNVREEENSLSILDDSNYRTILKLKKEVC